MYVHLTNDAVQQNGGEYGKFEQGNKISFNEFQRYLNKEYPDRNYDFINKMQKRPKFLATSAIQSVYGKIDPYKRENSFEVSSFDSNPPTRFSALIS